MALLQRTRVLVNVLDKLRRLGHRGFSSAGRRFALNVVLRVHRRGDDRLRREAVAAVRSSEGLLIDPTPAASPLLREPLKMPHSCPSEHSSGPLSWVERCYSMTSSARARIDGGIVRPR